MSKIIKKHWSIFIKMLFLVLFFVVIGFGSKYFFFKALPAKGSWLATTTWIGTASTGNWHDPSKWDNGVPTSTMLAIIASSSAITITATTTIEFDTLRIGGGGGTASTTLVLATNIGAGVDINIKTMGKIVQSSTVQQTISGTLLIESGGRLTHASNSSTQARIVNFNAQTITVNSGGVITANNVGYAGSIVDLGKGPGGGQSDAFSSGGGGGHGGNGGNDSVGSPGGLGYCDITNVNTMGSGGGGSSSFPGTAGGGLIILSATGTITINGAITADGEIGGGFTSGGGAGGGIKITADVISGTPSRFSAAGGTGNNASSGGGGCINIFYTTSNSITPTSSYFSVNGGTNSDDGSGGMVLVKQIGANGDLFILNGALATTVTEQTSTLPSLTVDTIYVSSTIFQVSSTKTLTLVNDNPFFGNDKGEIRVYGSLLKSVGVFDSMRSTTISVEPGARFSVSSTFMVSSSLNLYKGFVAISTDTFSNLIIGSGTTTAYSYSTSSAIVLSNLTMNGGFLTHGANSTTQDHVLNISATSSITINANGTVTASGTGYRGGYGTYGNGYGPGASSATSSAGSYAAGAGHGGNGADVGVNDGGKGYCDITNVSTIGSGGASGSQTLSGGVAGGGLIILSATGTITINGSIVANGVGEVGQSSPGGGAGGGIKLTADTIAGTPVRFQAMGGSNSNGGSAGGGGGGCVDIFYTTSNSITPTSSYFSVSGGIASVRGSGGMVLVKQVGVNNGGLYVLNSQLVTALTQPSSTVPNITADFIYVSSTVFVVSSSHTLTLGSADPFAGNSLGEVRVYGSLLKPTGFSNINNINIAVFAGGTMNASSTVNLGASSTLRFTTSSTFSGNINTFNTSGTLHIYSTTAISSTINLSINFGTTTFYYFTTSSPFYLSSLTVNATSTLTHATNTAAQESVLNITVSNNITINPGGKVNVTGQGYYRGAASNGIGLGPGGGIGGASLTVGGGHGGNGGNATTTSGLGYCDITNVNTMGSGGGNNNSGTAGDGGGLIILTAATGTITINGAIIANGGRSTSNSGGGGAGGGIKITANVINGTPSNFSALGGDGNSSSIAGSGGGGCVDIFYTTSNSISPTSSYFSVSGSTAQTAGSGGMALVKQIGVNNGALYVLNNTLAGTITQITSTISNTTVDSIYVSSTIFQIASGKTFTLVDDNPFFGNGRGEIVVYGTMAKSVGGFTSFNSSTFTLEPGGSVTVSSTLMVSSSLNLYRGFSAIATNTFTNLLIRSGTTTLYDYNTSTVPLSLTTLTMNSSTVLTSASNTTAQANIVYVVASSTITINAGASVVVNGLGYSGGAANVPGYGPGYGSSTSAKGGGGGAHGGNGGDGASSGGPGGLAYCTSANPITIGSGGGGGNSAGGAFGGGLIWLSATGTVTISGSIKANGGATPSVTGGGGAGGGVRIIAGAVVGTPQSFTANGGNGSSTGGGGGGGCIYIQYSSSNSITAAMATTTGGTSGTGAAGIAGTFVASQYTNLPTVTNFSPSQTSTRIVIVTTTIADADLSTTTLFVFYSTDGVTWVSSTIANVTQGGVGDGVSTSTSTGIISDIDTNVSGSINLTFEWNVGVDLVNTEDSSVYIKIIPNDGISDGAAVSSTVFGVDTKAPTAPGSLVLFNTSTQSATFTFGAASVETNFSQYIIFYKLGSSGVAITDTAFTSSSNSNLGFINYNGATSTAVSGLATSTQYVFNIWVYDNFSYVPASTEVTFYTLANTPSAPTLVNQTTTSLDIAVTSGDTNPASVEYAIQETGSTNYLQSDGTLGASAVWATRSSWGTKTVIGLSANTSYTFKVKARNGNNIETAFSSTSSLTTLANGVTSLVATNSTITSTFRINLSWTTASQSGMKLERDNACDGSYDVTLFDNAASNVSSPTTTLSSLLANTCYRFRISSYNSAGVLNATNTAISNDITTPPAAPTNVTTVSVGTSSITWGWDAVTGATSYYVFDSNSVLLDTVSVTSSVRTGLTTGTSYSIFVRAANSNGTGVSSSIATAVTGPAAPAGLAAASRTTSTITWSWTNDGQYQFFAQNKNNTSSNSGWITSSTWLQSSLIANTAYTLQVKARDVSSTESGFTEITRYTAQNFPTSITFTTTTSNTITMVINGGFINLGSGSSLIHIDNGVGTTQDLTNTTTWQNTGLSFGELYTYTVYATNGDGVLTASTTGSKYTLAGTPAAPTVFNPSSSTLNIIITSGDSNSTSVQYAILETGSGNYVQSDGSLGASAYWASTSTWGNKTVTGLSVNTQYIFKAKARNAENTESSFGATASMYTYANIPGMPTLGSPATSSLSVTIDTNSNPSYTTYSIYNNTSDNYGAADGSPVLIPVWQTTSTWGSSYFATGLSPNTSYNFSVIARNGDGVVTATSSQSAAKYTLASVPSSVAAVADSQTQITLSWTGDATSSYAENITAGTNSGWTSASSYAFTGLTCATTYSFRVKAINGEGTETSFSSSVSVQTSACSSSESPSSGSVSGPAFPVTIVTPPPVEVVPIPPVIEPEPEIVVPTTSPIENIPPVVVKPPKQNPAGGGSLQTSTTKTPPKPSIPKEVIQPIKVPTSQIKYPVITSTIDTKVIKNTSTKELPDNQKSGFVSGINSMIDNLCALISRFLNWLKWW